MYISTETDYNNPQGESLENNKIIWYTVKANLIETQRERDERVAAMKHQMSIGIIQPNGLPVGITPKMVGAPEPQRQPQRQPVRVPSQQFNSNLGYLNKPKPTPEQLFQQRFGLRK